MFDMSVVWRKFGALPLEGRGDIDGKVLEKVYLEYFPLFGLYRSGKNPFRVGKGPVLTVQQSFVRDYDYEDLMRSYIVISLLSNASPSVYRRISFGKKKMMIRSTLRGFRFFLILRLLSALSLREQDVADMIKKGGVSKESFFFSLKDVSGYFNLGFSKVDFFGWRKALDFRLDFSQGGDSVDPLFFSFVGLNFVKAV